MDSITGIFLNNPLATAFGVAGLMCQLAWPMFRAHRTILTVQFGIGADYCVHYALLKAWSGAGLAGLGAAQTALTFLAEDRPWLRRMGLVFLPIVGVICYVTWSGVPSLFALIGVTLTMVGRMQQDTLRLRILLLAAAPFGIGYDVLVRAPAIIGGFVSATIATAMLVREIRERRKSAHAVTCGSQSAFEFIS
jgi:hypothetical protein